MKMEKLIDIVDSSIKQVLAEFFVPSNVLGQGMEYSLLGGGKRLRPVMLLASFFEVCGMMQEDNAALKYLIFAVESLHTYTLIHDDLPCMDNDIERRGKPCCHIKFGEAAALLAGDALLNASFESFIKAIKLQPNLIHAADYFYSLAGAKGLIAGQSLEFELDTFSKETLLEIFKHKTAALFRSSAYIGGSMGLIAINKFDPASSILTDLDSFALNYGLAFQLKDDLDDLNEKGYAARFGAKEAQKLLDEYKQKAVLAIKKYNYNFLTALANDL